ncbi:uncharacterized protein LOC6619341 [Drosophila sechellia]|uniref:uncharacterized protein LOC6619341 n=1 Tax=Drosophila sechellia TaxID=7238 RepID=UPI0013DE1773|nr:uncharacterized protein LOC6619341 [Drosophila sechellia]
MLDKKFCADTNILTSKEMVNNSLVLLLLSRKIGLVDGHKATDQSYPFRVSITGIGAHHRLFARQIHSHSRRPDLGVREFCLCKALRTCGRGDGRHARSISTIAHEKSAERKFSSPPGLAGCLDFLGSILKVVAGTPDAGDLEKSRVLEANNRQIEINTKIQSQINKLTATANLILKTAKESQIDTVHLYENCSREIECL